MFPSPRGFRLCISRLIIQGRVPHARPSPALRKPDYEWEGVKWGPWTLHYGVRKHSDARGIWFDAGCVCIKWPTGIMGNLPTCFYFWFYTKYWAPRVQGSVLIPRAKPPRNGETWQPYVVNLVRKGPWVCWGSRISLLMEITNLHQGWTLKLPETRRTVGIPTSIKVC